MEHQLKQELDGLLRYINRVRQEVAAIDRPVDDDDKFDSMGEQLEAVVNSTSSATNNIMEAMERNDGIVVELREKLTDPEQIALLDQVNNNSNDVFEACSFQDITGQRINKVAKSVTYVEDRVSALITIMGKDEMAKVEVQPHREKSADEALLNGPQMEGEGLSQQDIDELFV